MENSNYKYEIIEIEYINNMLQDRGVITEDVVAMRSSIFR